MVLLLSHLHTVEEDHVGTVVIFMASERKILVGADSREVEFSPTTHTRTDRYDKCKVITLKSKFVFAATGKAGHKSGGHPEFSWDMFAVAKHVADRHKTASLGNIAHYWGARVSALDNRDVKRGVSDSRSDKGQMGFFFGFVNHHPVVYQVHVSPVNGLSYGYDVRPTELVEGRIYPSGIAIDIPTEIAAGQTERARSWNAEFQASHASETWEEEMPAMTQWIIEKTIDFSIQRDFVGKPIDLVEVDNLGVHWINKKEQCK